MFDESPLLAYETGVHLGDGNLTFRKDWNLYRVTYAGNAIDDNVFYTTIFPQIIEEVYAKKPRIYFPKNENTVLVVLNSKQVAEFKIAMGLPSGNKKQIAKFPAIASKYPAAVLRGLSDADFTVTFRDYDGDGLKEYPRIEACFSNGAFAVEISRLLEKLEIGYNRRTAKTHGKYTEYRIRCEGTKRVEEWVEKIGFSNPKHLRKIAIWKEYGFYDNPSSGGF